MIIFTKDLKQDNNKKTTLYLSFYDDDNIKNTIYHFYRTQLWKVALLGCRCRLSSVPRQVCTALLKVGTCISFRVGHHNGCVKFELYTKTDSEWRRFVSCLYIYYSVPIFYDAIAMIIICFIISYRVSLKAY